MLLCGLRPGEVDALAWDAVDLDAKTIVIDPKVGAMKRASGGEALSLGAPKTAKSARVIAIPAPVVAALRAHRRTQAAEQLAAGPGYGLGDRRWTGLVFLNEVGVPMWPSNVRRAFTAICERAGIAPCVPYELRHSATTLLLAAGVPVLDVQAMLGHTDTRMIERVYNKPVGPVATAAKAMNRLFGA
jgi:integrase